MQPRHLLRAFSLALLPLALSFALTGCPKTEPVDPDGGTDGGELTDGGCTGSECEDVDAGPPPCASDWDDCGPAEVCDTATGECTEGTACNSNSGPLNCNWPEAGEGCGGNDNDSCVCAPGSDVCKKRRAVCEPCVIDEECGGGSQSVYYDRPANCAEFAGGNYCLQPAGTAQCPQGFIPDDSGTYCVPASGSCEEAFTCISDADCPEHQPLCNREKGICVKRCIFDLETGESSCPTGEVCHLDGKCRQPCDPADNRCAEYDPEYICKLEPAAGVYRCRYEGCIDSIECDVPLDSPYVGFCQLDTRVCVTDRCRPDETRADGSNPDCRLPNRCEESNETCVPMTCFERGGASLGCGINHLCCGECRNVTQAVSGRDSCDPVPCTGNEPVPDGMLEGCFVAPNPPWCQTCEANEDCVADNPKEHPLDQNLCLQVSQDATLCGNTCETSVDCPTRWSCQALKVACDPNNPDCGGGTCVDDGPFTGVECTSSGDCNADNNEICAQNPKTGLNECHVDGVFYCDCGNNGAPDDNRCAGGSAEAPRCARTGFETYRCIHSKVCAPNQQAMEACFPE